MSRPESSASTWPPGPAPDSKLSHSDFIQGTAGTQELIARHALQTGGATRFLGIWHTHPGGPARPSQMDLEGMAALTSFTPYIHRALMVIIGGAPAQWDKWVAAGGRPDVCVKVIERDLCTVDPNTRSSADQQEVPFGQYFPGGFSASARESVPRRRRVLQPLIALLAMAGMITGPEADQVGR